LRASYAFSGAFIVALAACGDSLEVDRCLDSGGSFDYAADRCDLEKNHPGPTESSLLETSSR
jgi:hypothetical protein